MPQGTTLMVAFEFECPLYQTTEREFTWKLAAYSLYDVKMFIKLEGKLNTENVAQKNSGLGFKAGKNLQMQYYQRESKTS